MGSVAPRPPPLSSRPATDRALQARHREDEGLHVLELSGEADIATFALLRHELAHIATTIEDAVVDVTRLSFCDVASAHLIQTTRRTPPLTVLGATGSVKRVFDLLDALRTQRRASYLAPSVPARSPTTGARPRMS